MSHFVDIEYLDQRAIPDPTSFRISFEKKAGKVQVNNETVVLPSGESAAVRRIIDEYLDRAHLNPHQSPLGVDVDSCVRSFFKSPVTQISKTLHHHLGNETLNMAKQLREQVPSLRPLLVKVLKPEEKQTISDIESPSYASTGIERVDQAEKESSGTGWKKKALLTAAFVGGAAGLAHWSGWVNLSPTRLYGALPESWQDSLSNLNNTMPEPPRWMKDSKAWVDSNMPQSPEWWTNLPQDTATAAKTKWDELSTWTSEQKESWSVWGSEKYRAWTPGWMQGANKTSGSNDIPDSASTKTEQREETESTIRSKVNPDAEPEVLKTTVENSQADEATREEATVATNGENEAESPQQVVVEETLESVEEATVTANGENEAESPQADEAARKEATVTVNGENEAESPQQVVVEETLESVADTKKTTS